MERIMITNMARRSDKRLECPPVEAVVWDKEESRGTEIANICRLGLRFRSEEQYEKGHRLMFEINGNKDSPRLVIKVRGKIANSYGKGTTGKYEYGVRFSSMQWHERNMLHEFVYAVEKRRNPATKRKNASSPWEKW